MAFITLESLADTTGALLGVDPGTKTFGLSISDRTRLISTPLLTIQRTKFSVDGVSLLKIFHENDCAALVVGLPINMDGSRGPRAQSVQDFCINLMKVDDIPIFLWDERLSTMAVTRTMLSDDMSRAKRAKNVDKMASAYILQGVLDRIRAFA